MRTIILGTSEGKVGMPVAVEAVQNNLTPLEIVERATQAVESDPTVRTVGFGGAPNMLGEMECDASIMCGTTLKVGVVGALKGYLHPISVARKVMENLPHVMLVGEGAARFAEEVGAKKGSLLSEEARKEYEEWLEQHVSSDQLKNFPELPLVPLAAGLNSPGTRRGTVAFIVRSSDCIFAGGVSTSGWAFKYPGRLGDSPVIGAGLYVDNRYGAATCTCTGEMTIRAGTSRAIVAYMKKGASVEDACKEALEDLSYLKGGAFGPVIIHAMDRNGCCYGASVGMQKTGKDTCYWCWNSEKREIERVSIGL